MNLPPGLQATDVNKTDNPPLPGQHVAMAAPPGYELLDEAGSGGMGVVYRARDLSLDREVAIKLLLVRFTSDGPAARRFLDEARITGQLQHPGIPPVHQVGTMPDGRPFLAMKLIRGRTLDKLLRERTDPAVDRGRFVAVFEQVCQAVAFAHANDVIHRDLKPANVMVGAFGEVQVMDWGLAKELKRVEQSVVRTATENVAGTIEDGDSERTTDWSARGDGSDTKAGSVIGTPAFMPPEQARGEIEHLDARADVFGLGAILCVVLTGQPPFVAKGVHATLTLAAAADMRDPWSRLDACGAEPNLVSLCKRCLTPEKANRPADAGELATAVAALRAEAEARARRAELDQARSAAEAQAQRARRRAQVIVAGSVLALAAIGAIAAWWWDRQRTTQLASQQRNGEAVASLLDRSEEALRSDDASAASLSLEQAEKRSAEGGAEHLSDRLAQCRDDWDILRDLDRIDALKMAVVAGQYQGREKAVQEWPGAFARFGIVPGITPAEDTAARLNRSLVRDRLLAAIDMWLVETRSSDLAVILRAADPDAFRQNFRDAVVAGDKATIKRLADQQAALDQPARFAIVLADFEAVPIKRASQILLSALGRRPGDFSLLMSLGLLYPLNTEDKAVTAIEREKWFRAAIAVRPSNVSAHNQLGIALADQGNEEGAIAAYRESIRLDAQYYGAHANLGLLLRARNDVEGAIAECAEAVRLAPLNAALRSNLGAALLDKGDLDGAMAAYKEAIRINPNMPQPHYNLGAVLSRKREFVAALTSFREAARLNPKDPEARSALADAMCEIGDVDRAIETYKEAIAIDPKFPFAHNNLGNALGERGDLVGAIASLKEAARLSPKNEIIVGNLRDHERWHELFLRLPATPQAPIDPKTPAEAIEFAQFCRRPFLKRYALAARYYAWAFDRDATISDDWAAGYRYNAACYAALAAAGKDSQMTAFGIDEWGYLTDLAHRWLRADLSVYASLAGDPKLWPTISAKVGHWKRDSDLVAVRDAASLVVMPEVDRKRWVAFWTDVDALLKQVNANLSGIAK